MACVGIWKGYLINFNCSSFPKLGDQGKKGKPQPSTYNIKKKSVLNKKAIIIPNIQISAGDILRYYGRNDTTQVVAPPRGSQGGGAGLT